jgi:hypothetical protein
MKGIGIDCSGGRLARAAGIALACLGLLVATACGPYVQKTGGPEQISTQGAGALAVTPVVKIIQPAPGQHLISTTVHSECGINMFEATATTATGVAITDPNLTEWRLIGSGNPPQNLVIGTGTKGSFPVDLYGTADVIFKATDPSTGVSATAQMTVYVDPCIA